MQRQQLELHGQHNTSRTAISQAGKARTLAARLATVSSSPWQATCLRLPLVRGAAAACAAGSAPSSAVAAGQAAMVKGLGRLLGPPSHCNIAAPLGCSSLQVSLSEQAAVGSLLMRARLTGLNRAEFLYCCCIPDCREAPSPFAAIAAEEWKL